MEIKGRRWNMRQSKRSFNPFKLFVMIGIIALLVYIDRTVEPFSPSLFLASPTPTISPETYISEAETLASQGKYSQALQAYEKAIIADPQNPANYVASARLYIFSGNYQKAIENASNAVLLNQTSSMGEALKGFALGLLGQYLDAEGSLNRAIELDPSNSSAYAFMSLIISQKIILGEDVLGDLDRAIEASRKAESIAPDSLESYWARGVVLEITANYEDAVVELEKAVAKNSNIAELHIALGRNYRFLNMNDKAVEEYTRANALNPADPYPDTLISKVYANIGEFARAIQYAEQAVADSPEDPYLYGNLGVMFKKNYELNNAALMLKLALQGGLTPEGVEVKGLPLAYGNIVEYYYTYGLTLMELGYCGEATDIAQSIIQSIEGNEIATYNANFILDRCYKKINDMQLLKLPTPTFLPTWTPRPSATPTLPPTLEPSVTPIP